MRVVSLALLSTLVTSSAAQAQSLHAFCAAAGKPVQADSRLTEAVAAAFGPVDFTSTGE